jgi:hypothetical protein
LDFFEVGKWEYDQNDQEIYAYYEDMFINGFVLENRQSVEPKYDTQGNLVQQVARDWSDWTWTEFQADYQYDAQNRIIEQLDIYAYSYNLDYSYQRRTTFEYDDAINKKMKRQFSLYDDSVNWVINLQLDSLFSETGCLLEIENKGFSNSGVQTYHSKEIWTYTNDCQPLTYEYWTNQSEGEPLKQIYKWFYEYSTDGNTTIVTHERFNTTLDDWKIESVAVSEMDEEQRLIRQYNQTFVWTIQTNGWNFLSILIREK